MRIGHSMKMNLPMTLATCVCLAVVAPGCHKKVTVNTNTDLESAASKFAIAETVPAPAPAPASADAPQAPAALPPAQEMKQAVEAYKGGQFEDAVRRLQQLRSRQAMTPQQYMAINDAITAVTTELYALAAKGDPRAVQALKQYEKMQTQRR